MDRYYVNNNAQSNGDHEVHKDDCLWIPYINSKTDLGYHDSCATAVQKARTIHQQSNGCAFCAPRCHTS